MTIRIGINANTWTNDDVPSLGDDAPLEICPTEPRAAGFRGTELGIRFPRTSVALAQVLADSLLKLVSGRYDGRIPEPTAGEDLAAILPHLTLLRDCGMRHVVYADTSRGRQASSGRFCVKARRRGKLLGGKISMAGFIEGSQHGRTVLFPKWREDWSGGDNLSRIIGLFVD